LGWQIIYDPSMAKPIYGMIPPSGWHYVDGDVRLNGHSYDNLLDVVQKYRAENNIPFGDVTGDVNSYICSNWPQFCHGVDMVSVTSVLAPTATTELMNDIQTWVKNLLHSNKQVNFVTEELAEARAKTCLSCPQNVNWRGGCSSCVNSTDRISASVRQGRDTKSSQVLGGCMKMRHDNRSAIFFDKDTFDRASNMPENCWLNL
jgi:hypothetical protein